MPSVYHLYHKDLKTFILINDTTIKTKLSIIMAIVQSMLSYEWEIAQYLEHYEKNEGEKMEGCAYLDYSI